MNIFCEILVIFPALLNLSQNKHRSFTLPLGAFVKALVSNSWSEKMLVCGQLLSRKDIWSPLGNRCSFFPPFVAIRFKNVVQNVVYYSRDHKLPRGHRHVNPFVENTLEACGRKSEKQ